MFDVVTLDKLQEQVNLLPLPKVLGLLDKYQAETGVHVEKHKHEAIITDWQTRLSALGINSNCPSCGSKYIAKFGSNGSTKRFQCKICKKTFSLFTNTILEKTKYDWSTWVKVLHLLLTHESIQNIHRILVEDDGFSGLDYKTVFIWCHKIIHAIAQKPLPKLSGVIQIDETFFHESQKGSRKLKSYIKGEERLPASKKPKASYGCNGNEFSNAVCLIDSTGHCVAKVVGLGSLSFETFVRDFSDYIDKPTFICADGNPIYKRYCEMANIPLYIHPSGYHKQLKNAGYISTHGMSDDEAKAVELKNKKIIEELYNKKELDHFECYTSKISYKKFQEIKKRYSLSLNRVNQLHRFLKEHIEYGRRNVSTKFLPDYVAFEIFQRNWKVDHGAYPHTRKDAESILIEILKPEQICTKKDIFEREMTLSKRSDKSMSLLKKKTLQARALLKDSEFEFDEEDGVISFDRRKFLERLPQYRLDALRKKYKIPKSYVKYSVITSLLSSSNIKTFSL